MIKFSFSDEHTNLGLGLSRENINRLITGKPIVVKLPEMGINVDGNIIIIFGETERELTNTISEFIGPKTRVKIDPRVKRKLT